MTSGVASTTQALRYLDWTNNITCRYEYEPMEASETWRFVLVIFTYADTSAFLDRQDIVQGWPFFRLGCSLELIWVPRLCAELRPQACESASLSQSTQWRWCWLMSAVDMAEIPRRRVRASLDSKKNCAVSVTSNLAASAWSTKCRWKKTNYTVGWEIARRNF